MGANRSPIANAKTGLNTLILNDQFGRVPSINNKAKERNDSYDLFFLCIHINDINTPSQLRLMVG